MQVHWSWAWTLWPGQIGVHALHVNGHARKLLWSVQGTSARGRILLTPLFHRELRFGPIQARDVTANIQPTSVDNKPPPWSSRAWHVTFDAVSTGSLQRATLGKVVIAGRGKGTVSFTHQLRGGATRVFPSRVDFADAQVRYQQHLLLRHAKVGARFATDAFTHDQPAGWGKAERATGHPLLTGTTPALTGPAGATNFRLSEGQFNADLSFDHGALIPGGHLQWNGPLTTVAADGAAQRHAAHVAMAVGAGALALTAKVLPAPGSSPFAADNVDVQLQFASRHLLPLRSYPDTIKLVSASSHFQWHFASLKWLTPLVMSTPWLHLKGSGEVAGQLRVGAGVLMPGSRVEVPKVALTVNVLGNTFVGDAHALVTAADGAADAGLVMALTADRFAVAAANSTTPYLRGKGLQLDMRSSRDLARFRKALAARLRFTDANIPDLRAYNHYLPGKSLRFLAGTGTVSTDIQMDGAGNVSSGRIKMNSRGAKLALGPSRLSGNLHMDTQLSATKRGQRAYDIKRWTLALDGVRLDGSNDPPWWARFTVNDGRLDWAQPMMFRGHVKMVMKDVGLLLSLFADRGAFPKWITHVVDDGQTSADAQLEARHGDFILDQLVASNDRVDLLARLRIRDGKPNGSLYVRWGVLGLGVALTSGKRQFHLLHAARWYHAQPNLLVAPQPP
ncbi:MAG: hypothetical protein ABI114_18065 [Rhodanobacter sp.]